MKEIAVSCSRIARAVALGAALATGSIFAAEVWVKSAEIDGSGNIVLTALNRGLMIYMK